MRGAGRLYLLHVALAGVGAILLAGGTAMIFSRQSFSVPTSQAVSDACHNCLTAGGPAALLGLSVAALALAAVCLGLRSVHRQVRATSRYLATQDLSAEPVEVDGIPCRLIDSEEPRAFCAGYLRPRVYLSRGAQEQPEDDELRGILDPNLQVPLLVAAACAGMMVCGPIALALGALLLSRHALRRRLA